MQSRSNYDGWDIRKIYEVAPDDILECEVFFAAFGKIRDINGHNLESIMTRPAKMSLIQNAAIEHEGLSIADTVLVLRTSDVIGITSGESIRVEGELYRVMSVSYPIQGVVRLDLQGVQA